ncbi:hypothetical protein ACS0TY_006507 [Phlomoides rotata]
MAKHLGKKEHHCKKCKIPKTLPVLNLHLADPRPADPIRFLGALSASPPRFSTGGPLHLPDRSDRPHCPSRDFALTEKRARCGGGENGRATAAASGTGEDLTEKRVILDDLGFSAMNTIIVLKRERELQAKEAELKRREQDVRRKEEAAARAGIVLEEKNWPPFFPIIHHDIANEIPIHLQKLQYVAFTTLLDGSVKEILNVMQLKGHKVWEIVYSKDGSVKEILNVMQLKGHKSAVTWLCFSPNSDQIITASKDGSIRIWNFNGMNSFISSVVKYF